MTTIATYLDGVEPSYALYDPPAARSVAPSSPAAGVLLCPLFGNEDLCAYRARRDWAKLLAAAGHPTLRIDLPGTGDSPGGPHDADRVGAWTDALATAAAWLRSRDECPRVVAIGIGLGGLLAYAAASARAPIDDLVLWSVPARGNVYTRQLRALAGLQASMQVIDEEAADEAAGSEQALLPRDAIGSGGFVMSAETVAALDGLDLAELSLSHAPQRRVLMLERDGIGVDRRLRAALERSGVQLTVAAGPGYGSMITAPQQSRPPLEVFATVQSWLAAAPARSPGAEALPGISSSSSLTLEVGDSEIRETPIAISHPEGELVGVLAEPMQASSLCAVFLNAGALRHIGQNRMWVEAARRWASRGIPTLRVDLTGIGDADGDANALARDQGFYVPRYIGQTHAVLAALAERGLPERFVLAGLCSGAYWSFHAALEDERVMSACMVNPRALFWDWSLGGVREARNVRKVVRPRTWRKLLSGEITPRRAVTIASGVGVALRAVPGRALADIRARRTDSDELDRALDRLEQNEAELVGIFTAAEPLYEEFDRDGRLARMRARPNVRIEAIPGPLTSHTLEPLPLQRTVHQLLDDALERVMSRPGAAAPLLSPRSGLGRVAR